MDFERLDYSPYLTVGVWGLVTTIIIAFVLFCVAWELKYSPSRATTNRKIPGNLLLVATALAISGVLSFGVMAIIGHASSNANEGKATQNLMEKYDIQKVRWDAPETTAHPVTVEREGDLLVEATNGQLYVFKYTVEKTTSEPILKNMPIHGGNTPDASTSADALLRK